MHPKDSPDNTEKIAYMRGRMKGIEDKIDVLNDRQDNMGEKLDTLIDQVSLTRALILAAKAFLAGSAALLGLNIDVIYNLFTGPKP